MGVSEAQDAGAWRLPNESERDLVSRLLGAGTTPAKQALASQWANVRVRPINTDGSLAVRVTSAPPAEVAVRVPVEATVEDSDGIIVHVLLHVVGGYLNELEIYREDSEPPRRPIEPAKLEVVTLPFEWG